MKNNDTFFRVCMERDIPVSELQKLAEDIRDLSPEEKETVREQRAREFEERFPWKPGRDPDLPGIPIAEVSFTTPAAENIRFVADHYFTEKKDRMTMLKLRACLQVGDIQKEIDSAYRRSLVETMDTGFCREGEFDAESSLRNDDLPGRSWSCLKSFLKEGKQLRIWYSSSPEELCGFYHLCTCLEQYDQSFYAVRLPEFSDHDGKPEKVYSWNQMSETEILKAVETARLLSKEEIAANADIWRKLVKENAPMRAVINGQLVSVPEEFYDSWIMECIPTDQAIPIQKVMERFCSRIQTVETGWVLYRIEKMIRGGKIGQNEKQEIWRII